MLTTRPAIRQWALGAGAAIGAVALFAGCSSTDGSEENGATDLPGTREGAAADSRNPEPEETAGPRPRIVATYDGGLLTLDANTLEVVDDASLDGFLRVNSAGDGRTVFVSTTGGFRAFDAGTWSIPHGDHSHSYIAPPHLTEAMYPGSEPGHVVSHSGKTTLFSDGDGRIQVLDTEKLRSGEQPEAEVLEVEEAHHGVAVALPGDTMLETVGTETERSGARVLDAHGHEIAATSACPGVHGETAAAGGHIALGCENGIVVWDGETFTKVDSPDGYGRIGTQSGTEDSAVVLGDYKTDRDNEHEHPTRISLTDTESKSMRIVDIGTSYSFRSLGRGPDGEALVLGTDGKLHVLDPRSGEETRAFDVVSPWTEPERWQEPRPTLLVIGSTAYVTDPGKSTIHAVDLASGNSRTAAAPLPRGLNELAAADGEASWE